MYQFEKAIIEFNALCEKYARDVKRELNPAAKEYAIRVMHVKQKLDEAMDEIQDLVDDFTDEIEENIDVDSYSTLEDLENVLNYYR